MEIVIIDLKFDGGQSSCREKCFWILTVFHGFRKEGLDMKIAIVGCGGIAKVHAGSIDQAQHQIVAFADIKKERAEAYSKEFTGGAAAVYGSFEEMLEKESFDVLHICTPHYLHVPMAIAGLKKGVHVFMEKPPAISRAQFEELKAAAAGSGRQLGICFQNRYNQSVQKALALVRSGECGPIKSARAFVTWSRGEAYYTESGWRGALATEGGGALINQSIHTLDLMTLFMGPAQASEATISNHHLKGVIEVEDTMEAFIRYEKGIGLFYCSTAFGSNAPILLEIHCEKKVLRIEGDTLTIIEGDKKTSVELEARVALGKGYWGTGHTACISDFYRAVQAGEKAPIGLPQVENTFLLMMDLYDSARGIK